MQNHLFFMDARKRGVAEVSPILFSVLQNVKLPHARFSLPRCVRQEGKKNPETILSLSLSHKFMPSLRHIDLSEFSVQSLRVLAQEQSFPFPPQIRLLCLLLLDLLREAKLSVRFELKLLDSEAIDGEITRLSHGKTEPVPDHRTDDMDCAVVEGLNGIDCAVVGRGRHFRFR